MRDTTDYGIDLGTTNSAMAVSRDGAIEVIKNNRGADSTPSAVAMPRPGVVFVGERAKGLAQLDPENGALEFKLRMGLAGADYHFVRAGVTLTPQQLSAEVLRSLRGDAEQHLEELPEAAVITVPARFGLNQNQATSEAARLAGFQGPCPLIQEPTAAAYAYGLMQAEGAERVNWLVFDFGGGTFDAAIVRRWEGEIQVLDHAGDTRLGGKLIDEAIVRRILAPAAARELGLRDPEPDDPTWQLNLVRLKGAAEEAKIELSRSRSSLLEVELVDGRGGTVEFEHTLSREVLEGLAEPFYLRAVDLCRDALREGGLGQDQVDRVLLVGSPTLAPGLRELLADPRHGLGVALDFSQEPSTVVARGAAIYASTVPVDRPLPAPEPGSFTVDLAYQSTVSTTAVPVSGRVRAGSSADLARYSIQFHNPNGMPAYHGPRITLDSDGTFSTEVRVAERTRSTFTVELYDGGGARQRLTPGAMSVTHGPEVGDPVLTSSMGIRLADGTFARMLAKGTPLPEHAEETFVTSIALRRADRDAVISIPVIEGERTRADRNRRVGSLEIRPTDIGVDLPQGSEVQVTIDVDLSRLLSVVALVPRLDREFEAEYHFSDVRAPSPEALGEQMAEAEARLEELRSGAEGTPSPEPRRLLARIDDRRVLETAREEVEAATTDPGAALAATHRLQELHADLDELEDLVGLPDLVRELRETVHRCAELVERSGSALHEAALTDVQRRADAAAETQDPEAVKAALQRARELEAELAFTGPQGLFNVFQVLRAAYYNRELPPEAGEYVREGEKAVEAGDRMRLEAVVQGLLRMLPPDTQGGLGRRGGLG